MRRFQIQIQFSFLAIDVLTLCKLRVKQAMLLMEGIADQGVKGVLTKRQKKA